VMSQDYLRTARSKGLHEMTVLSRHTLRNVLIPVVTVLGLEIAVLFGGAVITETVFSWPGMGQLAIAAVAARDYPLVQATVFVTGFIVATVSFLVDVLYGIIDPRIRV
jgi:peptide/nickel transport system permease protein